MFFTVKILSVRILLMHPVCIYISHSIPHLLFSNLQDCALNIMFGQPTFEIKICTSSIN